MSKNREEKKKICKGYKVSCGLEKPLSEFPKRTDNNGDDYKNQCRECTNKQRRESYKPVEKEIFKPGFKKCEGKGKYRCGKIKLLLEFPKHSSSSDGHRNQCKGCLNESLKEKRKYGKEILPEGFKKCNNIKCKNPIKPFSEFYKKENGKFGLFGICKDCDREKTRIKTGIFENHKKCIRCKEIKHNDEFEGNKIKCIKCYDEDKLVTEKRCTGPCGEIKHLSEFDKHKGRKDGHVEQCKGCISKRRTKPKEIFKEGFKRCTGYKISCNKIKSLDEVSIDKRTIGITYLNQCKGCAKEQSKQYREEHKEELKQWANQYQKNRKKNDIEFKILCNLRSGLWRVLKGAKKADITMKLVGCKIKFLIEYIEKQFTPEMNWDNYGKNKYWEIDNIIPCSYFDLTDPEKQRKCFHYSNLQPLTIKENRQKHDKLNWI